jgi:hypothetical protein
MDTESLSQLRTSSAGLMPMLALAVKCVSLARIAGTLVETYLGRTPVVASSTG